MTDEQIDAMLKDILKDMDYDIYKDVFEAPEGDDEAADTIMALRYWVRKHLKEAGLPAYP